MAWQTQSDVKSYEPGRRGNMVPTKCSLLCIGYQSLIIIIKGSLDAKVPSYEVLKSQQSSSSE